MDLLTLVDGRYTEASNWYILKTRTPSGRLVQMTAGFDTSFKEMLVYDLLTYADRSKHKAMKLAKRLWSYSIHAKDYGTLAVLEPLFQSDAAALNQVLATVETLEMLHTRRYAPKSVLLHQLKVPTTAATSSLSSPRSRPRSPVRPLRRCWRPSLLSCASLSTPTAWRSLSRTVSTSMSTKYWSMCVFKINSVRVYLLRAYKPL